MKAEILNWVRKPLPSTHRQVLSKMETWFKSEAGASDSPEDYMRLSRECKSLRDGLASRDAGESDWQELAQNVIDLLDDDDDGDVNEVAAMVAKTFSEADLSSLDQSAQDALRAKKGLLNYANNVRSLPKSGDERPFHVLRLPIIPIAKGFVDIGQLEKTMLATNLDGKYFVLPNQLVVAINTKRVLSPVQVEVPNLKEQTAIIKRDVATRMAIEKKELEAKFKTMPASFKRKQMDELIEQRKKALHAEMLKKLQDEVATYRGATYDKFEARINSMMKSVKPTQDLASKHHVEWRDKERSRIEAQERVAYDADVEQYRAKLAKSYKLKFAKVAANIEAEVEKQFAKVTPALKQQLMDKAISDIEARYAQHLEDELAELQNEVQDAKRRNKDSKDPSANSAERLDNLIAAMEHKLGRSLTVMEGMSKYKTSGYLYYWVCDDATLSKLRSAFKGSFVIERWGFPF